MTFDERVVLHRVEIVKHCSQLIGISRRERESARERECERERERGRSSPSLYKVDFVVKVDTVDIRRRPLTGGEARGTRGPPATRADSRVTAMH